MTLRGSLAALIAINLTLAACTTPTGPQRYTGVYALAFEMQAFTPDGRGETWWATLDPKAQAEMKAALPPSEGPRFGSRIRTEVDGTLSEPGHYGHLGAYPRHLTITHVISAKLESKP